MDKGTIVSVYWTGAAGETGAYVGQGAKVGRYVVLSNPSLEKTTASGNGQTSFRVAFRPNDDNSSFIKVIDGWEESTFPGKSKSDDSLMVLKLRDAATSQIGEMGDPSGAQDEDELVEQATRVFNKRLTDRPRSTPASDVFCLLFPRSKRCQK